MNLEIGQLYIADGWEKPKKFEGYIKFDGKDYISVEWHDKTLRKYEAPKYKFGDLVWNKKLKCKCWVQKNQESLNPSEIILVQERLYDCELGKSFIANINEVVKFSEFEPKEGESYRLTNWHIYKYLGKDYKGYYCWSDSSKNTHTVDRDYLVSFLVCEMQHDKIEAPKFEYGQLYISTDWKTPRTYRGADPYDSGFFIFQETFVAGGNVHYCNSLNSPNIRKFEPEKDKKYIFGFYIGDKKLNPQPSPDLCSEYYVFHDKAPDGDYWFKSSNNNYIFFGRNKLENYLIGEYREERHVGIDHGKPGGDHTATVKIKNGHVCDIKIKEEKKMREFVKGTKYNLNCFDWPSPQIYYGICDIYYVFIDRKGDSYKINVNEQRILDKITEYRELEKLSFVQYARKFDKDKIADIAHNRNSYSDIPELLGENAKTPFGNHKIFKLDITATEVSEEEINKIKEV